MREWLAKFVLVPLFLISASALAESTWIESKIDKIYPFSNGDYALIFVKDSPNCPRNDQYHYVRVGANSVTEEGANRMLSIALTAATTDKSLSVNFDSLDAECAVNRMILNF